MRKIFLHMIEKSSLFLLFGLSLPAQTQRLEQITAELTGLHERLFDSISRGPVQGRSAAASVIAELARRKDLLTVLMGRSPRAAQGFLLSAEQRRAIALVPGVDGSLIERIETIEGTAMVYVVERSEENPNSLMRYTIAAPDGEIEAYQHGLDYTQGRSGDFLRVEGWRLGRTILTSSATVLQAAADPECSPLGAQRIAVIVVQFTDGRKPAMTTDQIRNLFFGKSDSVSEFITENSYARASLTGEVVGPVVLPAQYSDAFALSSAAIQAASRLSDLTKFNRVAVIHPEKKFHPAWSTVGCGTHSTALPLWKASLMQYPDDTAGAGLDADLQWDHRTILAHELGHGLGLHHSNSLTFFREAIGAARPLGLEEEYGDRMCNMGTSDGHYNAQAKYKLGWLGANEVRTVTSSGEHELTPLESARQGVKALRIKRAAGPDQWIWLEYQQFNFECGNSYSTCGALGHVELPFDWQPGLLDKSERQRLITFHPAVGEVVSGDGTPFRNSQYSLVLRPGEGWLDGHSGLKIETLQASASNLRMQITYEEPCVSVKNATVQLTAAAQRLEIPLEIRSGCNWTSRANNHWLSLQPRSPSGAPLPKLVLDVEKNDNAEDRIGSVTAGRRLVQVRQSGLGTGSMGSGGPTQNLFSTTEINLQRHSGSLTIQARTCSYRTWSDASWLTVIFDADPNYGCFVFLSWPANMSKDARRARLLSTGVVATVWQEPGASAPGDYMISLVAGSGSRSLGGNAKQTLLNRPGGLALLDDGVLAISDSDNHRVLAVSSSGDIRIHAGNGYSDFAGDGGDARAASFWSPGALCRGADSSLYVADYGNVRLRRVGRDQRVGTVAGSGSDLFSKELTKEGAAVTANGGSITAPTTCASAKDGTTYLCGQGQCFSVDQKGLLRLISHGLSDAENVPIKDASIHADRLITLADGSMVYSDDGVAGNWFASRVRMIDARGIVKTIAGGVANGYRGDGGPATAARFGTTIEGLAAAPDGSIYVSDTRNHCVRRIAPNGIVTTVAGTGVPGRGEDGVRADLARLNTPTDLIADAEGNLYISDTGNNLVRKLDSSGILTIVAGSIPDDVYLGDGGPAEETSFASPTAVAADSAGAIYVADAGSRRIRRIGPDGVISTVAGSGELMEPKDGTPADQVRLISPSAVAVDSLDRLYIFDSGSRMIHRVGLSGEITTIATDSRLRSMTSALVKDGFLYVATGRNSQVLRLGLDDSAAKLEVVAGSGVSGFSGDGGPASRAELGTVEGLAFSDNKLLVLDGQNGAIWEVASDSTIRVRYRYLGLHSSIAALGDGGLLLTGGSRIMRLNPNGEIEAIAGTVRSGYRGDGSVAWNGALSNPSALAIGPNGIVYVADTGNRRIRALTPVQ